MFEFTFSNLTLATMVFARMAGMFLLNPIFARRGIPNQVRIVLVLFTTLILLPTVDPAPILGLNSLDIVLGMIKELAIGAFCSFIFSTYYYMLFFTGEVMDMQFGLSMAKVFDPGTNVQLSVSGNILNLAFLLYFFTTNTHLLLIKLFAFTYNIIPAGAGSVVWDIKNFVITMMSTTFSLAMRLALPFLAAELVLEMSMGILMKLIPQIHVFVINIQFKILMGLVLLLAFAAPVTTFIDNYITLIMENLETGLRLIAGG